MCQKHNQLPLNCHKYVTYAIYIMCRYDTIMSAYMPQMNSCNQQRTTSTGTIHTFHIFGICSWRNMPVTFHSYVLLHYYCSQHIDPTLMHTYVKVPTSYKVYLPRYYHICTTTIFPFKCLYTTYAN